MFPIVILGQSPRAAHVILKWLEYINARGATAPPRMGNAF